MHRLTYVAIVLPIHVLIGSSYDSPNRPSLWAIQAVGFGLGFLVVWARDAYDAQ